MTLFDTSVLIAAFCEWHQDHQDSLTEWRKSLLDPTSILVAAHTLVEFYSVLTRLPHPHRLSVEDAFELLESNVGKRAIISLSPVDYLEVLADCRDRKIAGGSVYDALIVKSALLGQARRIVTLNPKHFLRLVPTGIEVVRP